MNAGIPSAEVERLEDAVLAWNERLRDAGAQGAERAFGLGCGIGLLPILILIAVLFIIRLINVILAAILVVIAFLALTGISALGAYYAQVNNMRRVYRQEVEPEIALFLAEFELERQDFDTLIYPMLPERAPLSLYLSPVFPAQESAEGEGNSA